MAETNRASKHFTQRQKARLEKISIGYYEVATARAKSYMEEKVAVVEQLKDKSKNAQEGEQAFNNSKHAKDIGLDCGGDGDPPVRCAFVK